MPHPYVTSAQIKKGKIVIGVETDDYAAGSWIEISGHATQTGGAFANFYAIEKVPGVPPGTTTTTTSNSNSDGTSSSADGKDSNVYVEAYPLPPNKFRATEDVSIVIRVGKVWLTVLGGSYVKGMPPGLPAGEGTKWDKLVKWSEVDRSLDEKDGYRRPDGSLFLAGGSSFPADGSSSPADSSSPA